MRKQDLIRAVAQQTRQSEAQTAAAVNALFATIQTALSSGDDVTISGFGSFRVVERASREGRNPQTGGRMTIAARKTPTFRAGSQLKRSVSG